MKLLLDEHDAKTIAEQLRTLGHDVVAVTERPDLVGLEDRDLFVLMADEQRVVVTENWADFQRELRAAEVSGTTHHGVLFTSRKHLPRSANTIGLFVRVLDDFLSRHPADDALVNSFRWLPDRLP